MSGRVKLQPHHAGLAFAFIGGVPPKAFLMYGGSRPPCESQSGVGNGVFVQYTDAPPEKARRATARMGKLSNHQAVLLFIAEANGSDSLYRMKIGDPGPSELSTVRDCLHALGLKYAHFVLKPDGVLGVTVRKAEWDTGGHVLRIVEAMAASFNRDVAEYRGTLEYLGSDVSRDEAPEVFNDILAGRAGRAGSGEVET